MVKQRYIYYCDLLNTLSEACSGFFKGGGRYALTYILLKYNYLNTNFKFKYNVQVVTQWPVVDEDTSEIW